MLLQSQLVLRFIPSPSFFPSQLMETGDERATSKSGQNLSLVSAGKLLGVQDSFLPPMISRNPSDDGVLYLQPNVGLATVSGIEWDEMEGGK